MEGLGDKEERAHVSQIDRIGYDSPKGQRVIPYQLERFLIQVLSNELSD